MLNDPVLTPEQRKEICISENQVIGDPYKMCLVLAAEVRDLRDQLMVAKGTYNTMDYLYDNCHTERVKLRKLLADLETRLGENK